MKSEERRAYWTGLVAEHASSGRSIAGFAKERGLSELSLWYWRRKLGCVSGRKVRAARPRFVEVVSSGVSCGVRMIVAGAVEIRSEEYPDPRWVAAVVREMCGEAHEGA